ncbi:hypothetical protein B0H13DRAFT_1857113 [Mycena leptocephala]|nr:hypothetical protein B0H13DRAFT_1857113 [Mycena leptocephala]
MVRRIKGTARGLASKKSKKDIKSLQLRFRLKVRLNLYARHRHLDDDVTRLSIKISQLIESHEKLVESITRSKSPSPEADSMPASDWTLDPDKQSQNLVPWDELRRRRDFHADSDSESPYIISVMRRVVCKTTAEVEEDATGTPVDGSGVGVRVELLILGGHGWYRLCGGNGGWKSIWKGDCGRTFIVLLREILRGSPKTYSCRDSNTKIGAVSYCSVLVYDETKTRVDVAGERERNCCKAGDTDWRRRALKEEVVSDSRTIVRWFASRFWIAFQNS